MERLQLIPDRSAIESSEQDASAGQDEEDTELHCCGESGAAGARDASPGGAHTEDATVAATAVAQPFDEWPDDSFDSDVVKRLLDSADDWLDAALANGASLSTAFYTADTTAAAEADISAAAAADDSSSNSSSGAELLALLDSQPVNVTALRDLLASNAAPPPLHGGVRRRVWSALVAATAAGGATPLDIPPPAAAAEAVALSSESGAGDRHVAATGSEHSADWDAAGATALCSSASHGADGSSCSWSRRSYRYYDQVAMDVQRTLSRFPPGLDKVRRSAVQRALVQLVVDVLAARPQLHYYQGYHDVAFTVLLVCLTESGGEQPALAARIGSARQLLAQLSDTYLRPFLAADMAPTARLLDYAVALVEEERPALAAHMAAAQVGTVFALPWVLTWFSHVLPSWRLVVRVFDHVLACGPLAPVYLTAALVLAAQEELLATSCQLAELHVHLSQLPRSAAASDASWQQLLAAARQLHVTYPPSAVQWRVERLQQQRLLQLHRAEVAVKSGAGSWHWRGPAHSRLLTASLAVLALGIMVQLWWQSRP